MMRPSLALFALVLLASCASPGTKPSGGDGSQPVDGMQQTFCKPGATQSCFCLGAGQGTQVCRADGKSYGSCTGCTADGFISGVSDMQAGNPCGDCDGCCNGSTCVTYQNQSNNECGVAGTVCGACSSGEVCDGSSGMCVMATNGCGGCGNGCCGKAADGTETCFINNESQCGTGGGMCTACTAGTLCASGACNNQIDPMYQFRVTFSSTQVFNTDASGNCWDDYAGFGCAQPDIQICLGYVSNGTLVQGCTTTIQDVPPDNGETDSDPTTTDTATWDSTDGLIKDTNGQVFYMPGSTFTEGKAVLTVQDVDTFNSNDIIGSLNPIAATSNYYTAYVIGQNPGMGQAAFGRVINVYFTLR